MIATAAYLDEVHNISRRIALVSVLSLQLMLAVQALRL